MVELRREAHRAEVEHLDAEVGQDNGRPHPGPPASTTLESGGQARVKVESRLPGGGPRGLSRVELVGQVGIREREGLASTTRDGISLGLESRPDCWSKRYLGASSRLLVSVLVVLEGSGWSYGV
ncbi:hypothetical protein CYMTET_21437 [Cymbomonas tetramitiformis]|uniref:Uncharacterized protein n=1 Tax=Cymbomonas tetramitiformis TaxID=36881 RepID=A0AAE0G255_9CHLO|nr:hypothetical protein CYMTET_21437 [Cymbomonas tetramitiformis]